MIRAIVAIALTLAAMTCRAQIDTPNEPTVFLDFGFAGEITAGAWSPVTAVVQSVDEPLSGYVELRYIAGGETVSHIAPFAVNAQDAAAIPMTVRFPWWTDSVTASVFDEQRGRVAQIQYMSRPGPNDARLPATSRTSGVVLSVTPRMPAGLALERIQPADAKPIDLFPINVPPSRLLPTRLAYDDVRLLIIDPADLRGADPRAIESVIRWTASGGRLLLIANRPGAEWQRILAATPATADIIIGPAAADEAGGLVRPILPGPLAAASGWITKPSASTNNASAIGPLGFGWIGVLGVDPADDAASDLARALLTPPSIDPKHDLAAALRGDSERWYDVFSARSSDWLLYQHIDAVASANPPGTSGFILIAAVPILLALLLGPMDFILLGKLRRRPFAWLSALVWISLVGAFAFVAPRFLQTGSADIGAVAATDLIIPNLAMPTTRGTNAAAALDPDLAGWSAGASILFHASRTPFTLAKDNRDAWRPFESGNADVVALAGTTFRQSPAGPGQGSSASVTPLRIPPRVWSLATLQHQGPRRAPFAVALTADIPHAPRSLTLDITGLPDTATIRAARIVHDGHEFTLATTRETPLRFEIDSRGDGFGFEGKHARQIQAAFAVLAGEPERRNHAIAALEGAGWARIDLFVETPPDAAVFETTDDAVTTSYTLYRILTPMPEHQP